MTSALAVRWPGAHERHIASGRAARKPRNACRSAASAVASGCSAVIDLDRVGVQRRGDLGRPADVLAADRDRLGGAEPEQVLVRAADQGAAAEPVVVELAVAREAAHDRDRNAAELALHQIAGRGDLVGDRDLGDLAGRCRSESVRPRGSVTAVRPATPMAVSVMPARQGRPIESLMMTPTVDAEPARAGASRSARAEASGSTGSSASLVARDVRQRRRRRRRARARGGSRRSAARRGGRPRAPSRRRSPSCRAASRASGSAVSSDDQPSLDLRDRLGRDDEDVAVLQRRARARRSARRGRRRAAARRCRGPAGSRAALRVCSARLAQLIARAPAPARTIAAVASSSVISSGTARTVDAGDVGGVGRRGSASRRAGRRPVRAP